MPQQFPFSRVVLVHTIDAGNVWSVVGAQRDQDVHIVQHHVSLHLVLNSHVQLGEDSQHISTQSDASKKISLPTTSTNSYLVVALLVWPARNVQRQERLVLCLQTPSQHSNTRRWERL